MFKLITICLTYLSATALAPAAPRIVSESHLSSPRAAHLAFAIDGDRIAIIGGCVIGNCDSGPASSTIEIFDAASGATQPAGTLVHPRIGAAGVALDESHILIVGGWSEGAPTATAEIFDTRARESIPVGSMSTARATVAAARLPDGKVLVAGGIDLRQNLATAEVFDPRTGRFTPVGPMTIGRSAPELTTMVDGRVLVTGGLSDGKVTNVAEIFDPSTGRFSVTGPMLEARYKHAAVALSSGRVLIVGGADERDYAGKKRTLELYDPAAQRFVPQGVLRSARFKIMDSVVQMPDGRVLIAGGGSRPEMYDPVTGKVTELPIELGASWNFMTATRLQRNRVVLAGGYKEGRIELTSRAIVLKL